MNKLKVIEFFAGIGSQHSALKRLGIDFEIVGIAEIDKYAIKSYEAIHGKVYNYGDISKIKKVDYADFWTYSFPCQDLSVAGKQKGLCEGTRSGLLYEVERLLDVAKEHNELPKYLMLENVKNLVGKKFKGDFDRWIGKLNQLGYNTYWKVLNAKNYGVPQNRERVFAISIRKDVDKGYQFPEPFESGIRLKDILEEEVDEKFYISNEKAKRLVSHVAEREQLPHGNNPVDGTINNPKVKDVSNCIKARYDMGVSNLKSDGTMVIKVGNTSPSGKSQCNDVIHPDGVYSTICAGNHGNANPSIVDDMYKSREPREYAEEAPTLRSERSGLKVKIPQATTKGYIECSVPGVFDMTYPDSKTRRGRVQDYGEIVPTLTAASQDIMYVEPKPELLGGVGEVNFGKQYRQGNRIYDAEAIAMCLLAHPVGNTGGNSYLYKTDYRIRKLTPKECFRLMGFTDEEFHKAEKVNSNSQLYKQAGNSIVVDVLYYLFKNIFITDNEILKERQITIFDRLNEVE